MTKRRRIHHSDKILDNALHIFSLLMFLQLKGYTSLSSSPLLLYSTENDIRIANITRPFKANTIIGDLVQGSAVDFLYRKNLICWSDQTAELIQCLNYNGTYTDTKIEVICDRLTAPTGVAIDWYTENLYWTDGETNRIEVINLNQKYRKVLYWSDVDLARAIAVVPEHGLMFWTDWGEIPKIERAGMSGNPLTRKVLVKDDIFWPNGITVDYSSNLIYWIDAKLQFVDVIDFEGNNRRRVVKGGLRYPYAIALYDEKLFWTDWKTWTIYSWDMSTNGPIKELIKSKLVPVDIRIYEPSRQSIPQEHPCKKNNGGCSHLCLLSPEPPGFDCGCPTGVKLREGSNTTCHDGPQSMLLVAQRSAISKISLDSPDFTPYTIPLKDVKRAVTVDFDQKSEYVYWADNVAMTISRARLDGSEQMTVIHNGDGVPERIAVDSLARNIYWTDLVSDTISVARLDGSCLKVLIHDDLYEPRAIALHPTAGWMFWTDWNDRKPKIERANLDGTERILLVSEKVVWPNGLALDTKANKVYWGDAKTRKIEVCNMDGTDRMEIHNNDILHIFSLTILGNYLYWTDTQRRTLDKINKVTGVERQLIVDQMANMMGLKAFHVKEQLGWNMCVENNGGCSHLCFNRPKDYVCSCPIGLELAKDRKTCIEPDAFLIYSRKNVIGRISIENENNDAVLPIKEIKDVSAIDVHISGSKLYWSESKTKVINRCSVNGSNMERIIEWTGVVEGLAVDWSGQNIYWTDSILHRIETARLDGSSRRILMWQSLKKPSSIVIDPKKGYMYWSELGSKTIKKAGMDGSNPTVILDQVGRANSLTIDYEKRILYWVSLDPPVIEYSHLDGSNRQTLVSVNITMPYALTLYLDKIYWGDWTTGEIEVAQKIDGTERLIIHKRIDLISDLKIYHKSRQAGSNQCFVGNGGCSHLCLATPVDESQTTNIADYRCACPTHYRLNSDNLTCSEPEEFLLFSKQNSVGRIMVANGECNDAMTPITGLKSIKAIEYDPINRHLYWIDEDSHAIRRVLLSSSMTSAVTESTVVVNGLWHPYHIVLDAIGRTLYWSCTDSDSINATFIDNNSTMGVIIRAEKMMPRQLAFHQTKRLLFWVDVGLSSIMRSNADGSARGEIAKAANATALTIDQVTGIVYWAMNKQIYAVDINGNNKRIIWQGGWVSALSAYSGALYLGGNSGAMGPEKPLMRIPLGRREAPATPVPHTSKIIALVTVHKVFRDHPCFGGAVCRRMAGGCLADGVCGCGAGCARAPTCSPGHYLCAISKHPGSSTAHCIPNHWKCDGQMDCPDGSDEGVAAECGACEREGGVRCADGACAASLALCDAGAHCLPELLPEAFQCDTGRLCLAPRLLCDEQTQCEDGSDEAPIACENAQKDQMGLHPSHGSKLAVVGGAIAGIMITIIIAWVVLKKWKKGTTRRQYRDTELNAAQRLYVCKPTMERARPLGASGSDSGCERYPRPTVNPPPSPATVSTAPPTNRRHPYRHYRAMNRPPPPTPCSTDACESDYSRTVHHAPPPTPCATSPPSPTATVPSSRSSTYFSPFPPPPSPVHHFSDS